MEEGPKLKNQKDALIDAIRIMGFDDEDVQKLYMHWIAEEQVRIFKMRDPEEQEEASLDFYIDQARLLFDANQIKQAKRVLVKANTIASKRKRSDYMALINETYKGFTE